MNAKFEVRETKKSKNSIFRKILLTVAGLLIICILLSHLLFVYIQYQAHNTQVQVYQLEKLEMKK